jgi:hypothetical protein
LRPGTEVVEHNDGKLVKKVGGSTFRAYPYCEFPEGFSVPAPLEHAGTIHLLTTEVSHEER